MSEHPNGTESRKVAQGCQGIAHHGDGTCTKFWAVFEDDAERKAQEAL